MATVAFYTVLLMLIYAVPGFFMTKTGLVKKDSIGAFATLLVYVCQPCLTVYSFEGVELTAAFVWELVKFFLIITAVLGLILGGFYFALRKKQQNVAVRIFTVASCFGNFTFMGIPLLEMLLPAFPAAKTFATMAYLSQSLLTWTVACAIISRDKRYISPLKATVNPATVSVAIAVIICAFKLQLPTMLNDAVTLVGKMSTPLCMMVLGMRLGAMKLKSLFTMPSVYVSSAVKLIFSPLVCLAVSYLLPISTEFRLCLYIIFCTPVASNVLSFAEMLGECQEQAANTVLFSTVISVLTMPIMMLLV